jgi:hypothetical protein
LRGNTREIGRLEEGRERERERTEEKKEDRKGG